MILLTDFNDLFFQRNPIYSKQRLESSPGLPDLYRDLSRGYLSLFEEFYPNMIVKNCEWNKKILVECYGEETYALLTRKVIVSSGAMIGIRDAIILWANQMTRVSDFYFLYFY